jgi:hypothetical protein
LGLFLYQSDDIVIEKSFGSFIHCEVKNQSDQAIESSGNKESKIYIVQQIAKPQSNTQVYKKQER